MMKGRRLIALMQWRMMISPNLFDGFIGKASIGIAASLREICRKNVWEYGDIKIDFNGYLAEKSGELLN